MVRHRQPGRPSAVTKPSGAAVDAVLGREGVHQAALLAVGPQLVLDVEEDLRRQRLDLEAHLVVDAVGTGQLAAVLAAQPVVEQAATFGQLLVGRGATSVSKTSAFSQVMTWPVRVMRTVSS